MSYDVMTIQNELEAQPVPDLYKEFMAYRADRKETTIAGYKVALKHFFAWIQRNAIREPRRADIIAYKNALLTERSDKTGGTLAPGTQARYLRAVKMFFKWAASEGLYANVADNICAPKIRQDNTHRDALREKDVRRILDSLDRNTATGKRDYAMILLSVTGALRIIELQRADISDLKTIAGEPVLFIQGKGRDEKDEYKKLVPAVVDAIKDYLATRPDAKSGEPLFTSTSNRPGKDATGAPTKRISEPGISRIIKTRFRAAGYDSNRITAHSLRHTGVTMLLKSGATLQEAQHYARHASPNTTGIYAHNLEREKDHSEQRVYDIIMGKDTRPDLQDLLSRLRPEQLLTVQTFVEQLAAA